MKPVLFSVSYAGFWGQARLSLEEFIPHARKLGYVGVELMGKRHAKMFAGASATFPSCRASVAVHVVR